MNAAHRSLALRVIYALCLAGATYNHWRTLIEHGLSWDYGGLPWTSSLFWTSLAILDPLAIALLFLRPNVGVAITAAIIIADVAHNLWIEAAFYPPLLNDLLHQPRLQEQVGFLIFVLATARLAWRRTPNASASDARATCVQQGARPAATARDAPRRDI